MQVGIELLQRFVPVHELPDEERTALLRGARVLSFAPGEVIFREGAEQRRVMYLLSGQVALSSSSGTRSMLRAGSARAQRPLSDEQRTLFGCVAREPCKVLSLPASQAGIEGRLMLDMSGYEVEEIAVRDSALWLRVLARTPHLLRIPTANMQRLIEESSELEVPTGQAVVRQGDAATDYFIVKQGTFSVTRRDDGSGEERIVAELGEGSAFGEDALISRCRRNASVVAREDSALLRLAKGAFTRLVVNPLLDPISLREAHRLTQRGAVLVDVRDPECHANDGLPNSLNVPFAQLRSVARDFDRNNPLVLYCQDGHLSAAAAFVLIQYGMTAYLIAGGLGALGRCER